MDTSRRSLSSHDLLAVLSLSPNATAVYTSEDIVIEMANDEMLSFWDKDRSVVGMPLAEAVPELAEQVFIGLLKNVWRTGETYSGSQMPATLLRNGLPTQRYFDFEYRAVKDHAGKTRCILHTATDVTDGVHARLRAAQAEAQFREVMAQAPMAIGLLEGPDLQITMANPLMLDLWGKENSVVGKPLAEGLPELEGQQFLEILHGVMRTGQSYHGNETRALIMKNGVLGEYFFNFVYQAIRDIDGRISIMIVAYEVSDQIRARRQIAYNENRLRNMVMAAPIGITVLKGRELRVEIANTPMLGIWARTTDEMIGSRLLDVFPELIDQPFPELLAGIFENGRGVAMNEVAVDIRRNEKLERIYVNFAYEPLFEVDGTVEAIMATVIDITEVVESRLKLEDSEQQLQAVNEELTAINEEQLATNDELLQANDELVAANAKLKDAQSELHHYYRLLADSEERFKSIFEHAPVGMALLSGEDLITELANDEVLKIWGRTAEEMIGRPHADARPELNGQHIREWLLQAMHSGETRVNNELRIKLHHNGGLREAWVNSIYHPIKDGAGNVRSLLVILQEITSAIVARNASLQVQQMFNMSIESAKLGTWSLYAESRQFVPSSRLKSLFGFEENAYMSYKMAMRQIEEPYRSEMMDAIEQALSGGQELDMEFPVKRRSDHKQIWLKASARYFPAQENMPSHFSGTMMDITERKTDEIRKNDFIAMVSHEMRTPLTSARAYVQMLEKKANERADAQLGSMLGKVHNQMIRLTSLINGFLDVSRLESGKIKLQLETFYLSELFTEISSEAVFLAREHRLQIEPCDNFQVHADKNKITQVITNLVSNAVKYAPRNTNITLSCKINGNNAEVSVKDEGSGINPEDQRRIFDRFYRVEADHTRSISGFGIGLYLCAEILQHHQGTIRVESEWGKGSTFIFTLPLAGQD
ncbi:PAS domain-containing protein [Pedobacter sp. SYP-B3415]|uniref:PAS domain-containing protein n=1 Tax=Pedobacter sp. SYP-B3415 TaxID=2496641 RepID=UPI00101C0B07|nr:PAS domain-containing protein [Pedobacter sp. SYP-B3415]